MCASPLAALALSSRARLQSIEYLLSKVQQMNSHPVIVNELLAIASEELMDACM